MSWDWKPSVIAGCAGLLILYGRAVHFRFGSRTAAWLAGVLLIFAALCSPLDELGDKYLFSVHMARHIVFVLIVPALLLIGIPRLYLPPGFSGIERVLRTPAIAWSAGIGTMIFWHIPGIFNAALASEPLHIVEHLSLLVGGTMYWWPVLAPLPESRMRPVPQAAAYLFTSCLACTAMGIAITFAPALLYPSYAHPPDPLGSIIREQWGISAAMDQQIGGLLMWVPGCLIYLTATMAMFARWYGEEPAPAMEV
jgi:putative membrane protein